MPDDPVALVHVESPRWLAAKGRYEEADRIVSRLEESAAASGRPLNPVAPIAPTARPESKSNWRELFKGIYLKRTLTIWTLWFCAYLIANGTITWLPTLYRETFNLPLQTSLNYGLITSVAGVIAAVICALLIDKVGRKRWYAMAFLAAVLPLTALAILGAKSATQVLVLAGLSYAIVQTITFSLYLYSAELYPTRLRAIGTGVGSAWLRLGSSTGPILVGWIIARFRDPIRIRCVRLCGLGRCSSDGPVRNRDQGASSRRTLAVESIRVSVGDVCYGSRRRHLTPSLRRSLYRRKRTSVA